jgi:hypothetical protein
LIIYALSCVDATTYQVSLFLIDNIISSRQIIF